jgi:hypothetical protein
MIAEMLLPLVFAPCRTESSEAGGDKSKVWRAPSAFSTFSFSWFEHTQGIDAHRRPTRVATGTTSPQNSQYCTPRGCQNGCFVCATAETGEEDFFLLFQEMLGRMQMIKRVASSGKAAMAAGGVVAAGASFKLLSSFAQVPDWGVLRRAPAIGAI